MNATTRKSDMPWARTVLVAAAAIATVSIGFSVSRQGERQAPAAPAAEQKQPDINDMISGLEARLKQEPGSEKGWRMLGWSYFQASRYTDAAGAYRKAAGISPGDAELWSALGESLVLAGNQTVSDEALDAFKKAVALAPADPRARFFIAQSKLEKGNPRAAIDDWLKVLEDSPPNAPWVPTIRQKVTEVATSAKIDVSSRLAALPSANPKAATPVQN